MVTNGPIFVPVEGTGAGDTVGAYTKDPSVRI